LKDKRLTAVGQRCQNKQRDFTANQNDVAKTHRAEISTTGFREPFTSPGHGNGTIKLLHVNEGLSTLTVDETMAEFHR
jgi:hypothetical protein